MRDPTKPAFNARLCARHCNPSSACKLCASACPSSCIEICEGDNEPLRIDADRCTSCLLCLAACPTDAITCLRMDLGEICRKMERLAQNYGRIYITCSRCDATGLSGAMVEVSCLGALPREFYAYFLACYENACIYQPIGICKDCPCQDPGEKMGMDAIAYGELAAGCSMDLACTPQDLDFFTTGLDGLSDIGRRGFFSSLPDLVADSSRRGASEEKGIGLSSRKKMIEQARRANEKAMKDRQDRFAEAHQTGIFRRTPKTLTRARSVLSKAVQQDSEMKTRVVLESVRSSETCTMCRKCLYACPLSARRIFRLKMTTDDLYCVACGKCADICPQKAIYKVEVPGEQVEWD